MYTPVNPSFTIRKWGLRGQNYLGVFSWCQPAESNQDIRSAMVAPLDMLEYTDEHRLFWSDAQADLGIRGSHMTKEHFSYLWLRLTG